MQSRNAPRAVAALLALSLLSVACGLKQDALNSLKQASANGTVANGEGILPGASPGTQTDAAGNPVTGVPGTSTNPGDRKRVG